MIFIFKTKLTLSIKYLIIITLFSFFLGLILALNVDYDNKEYLNSNSNFISLFLFYFSTTYWFVFLSWLFSNSKIGCIQIFFNILIVSFFDGLTFGILLKYYGFQGAIIFIKDFMPKLFCIFPLLFYLFKYSIGGKSKRDFNLILSTIIVVLYAIIKSFINRR